MIAYTSGPLVTAAGLAGLLLSEWTGAYFGVWLFKPLASLGFLITALPALAPSSVPHFHNHAPPKPPTSPPPTTPSYGSTSASSTSHPDTAPDSAPAPAPRPADDNPFTTPPAPSPRAIFNRTVFASLVLCALGDVLLIPSRHSPAFFTAGLASFLLGHVGFATAFLQRDLGVRATALAGLAHAAFAGLTWRWLAPHLPEPDRGPVGVYTVVIAAMGALAVGGGGGWVTARRAGPQMDAQRRKMWAQIAGAVLFELSDVCVARQQFVSQSFGNPAIGLPLYYAAVTLLATLVWPFH